MHPKCWLCTPSAAVHAASKNSAHLLHHNPPQLSKQAVQGGVQAHCHGAVANGRRQATQRAGCLHPAAKGQVHVAFKRMQGCRMCSAKRPQPPARSVEVGAAAVSRQRAGGGGQASTKHTPNGMIVLGCPQLFPPNPGISLGRPAAERQLVESGCSTWLVRMRYRIHSVHLRCNGHAL